MKRITLKLSKQEHLLLNAYLLHIQSEYGVCKTKQELLRELLTPILQATEEAYSFGDQA
jgi:hypothetical protein